MRLRLRLRLHPGRGLATLPELWLRWGRLAAFRRSGRARRSLAFWERARCPGYRILHPGRASPLPDMRCACRLRSTPWSPARRAAERPAGWPRSSCVPGPVISTTTKHDVFELTSGIRARLGPVHVFNPQGIGDVPITFRWNPLEGCQDPATAIRRADAFATVGHPERRRGRHVLGHKASDYLRAYFHAAAIGGLDLRVRRPLGQRQRPAPRPKTSSPTAPAPAAVGRPARRAARRGQQDRPDHPHDHEPRARVPRRPRPRRVGPTWPGQYWTSSSSSARPPLCTSSPSHAARTAPVAPLFACLASEIHYTAALAGSRMPGGRLDPPMLMALDKVTQICPVPVPSWLADSGGKGIQIITVAHGEAQLRARWGRRRRAHHPRHVWGQDLAARYQRP